MHSFYELGNVNHTYVVILLKKRVNGFNNIIPYIEGINIISVGSFESIQTFIAVVSRRLDNIFSSNSKNARKGDKYRDTVRDIFGETTLSQLKHLITVLMVV